MLEPWVVVIEYVERLQSDLTRSFAGAFRL